MAKHRTTTPEPPAPAGRRIGSLDAIALAAIAMCAALGYLSRQVLSPDGVSYLDLASAVTRGDWQHFVQGYWSPFYPMVTGIISMVTGLTGSTVVPLAHAVSAVSAIAGACILWRWGRVTAQARPLFGRLALAAFLLCSAGLPKIEAVTPDVVSLFAAIWISYELLLHGGRRWRLTGVALGFAFLVKTSAWPWLLLAVPLRIWAAPDAPTRRRVWWSSAVCAVTMLLWVVPLSLKTGRPTLGSSGRLNWSWYVDGTRGSQMPDADGGANTAYTNVPVGNGQQVTVAMFDDAEHWTYQPWGDPTAWSEKVIAGNQRGATVAELLRFWLKMFGQVFGLWLLPMIVVTLVPAFVLHHRPGIWRELTTTNRDALVVALVGLAGLSQFVIIHPEPRLIAPVGLLLALGTLWWCTASRAASADRIPLRVRQLLGAAGVVAALALAVPTFTKAVEASARLSETTGRLDDLRARLGTVIQGTPPIAVIGPAAPILSAAYWSGVHITMQVPPRSVPILNALSPEQKSAFIATVFGGRVPLVWNTTPDGGMEMLIVPRP